MKICIFLLIAFLYYGANVSMSQTNADKDSVNRSKIDIYAGFGYDRNVNSSKYLYFGTSQYIPLTNTYSIFLGMELFGGLDSAKDFYCLNFTPGLSLTIVNSINMNVRIDFCTGISIMKLSGKDKLNEQGIISTLRIGFGYYNFTIESSADFIISKNFTGSINRFGLRYSFWMFFK